MIMRRTGDMYFNLGKMYGEYVARALFAGRDLCTERF